MNRKFEKLELFRLNSRIVSILSLSVHHLDHGMSAIEVISAAAEGLGARLADLPQLNGVFVLATCNRFEIYLDTRDTPDREVEALIRDTISVRLKTSGQPALEPDFQFRTRQSVASLRHLLRVCSGLDSMVIGEREIAGQVRRALKSARAQGTLSAPLGAAVEQALKCSRRVSNATGLASQGRSLVATSLDLVLRSAEKPPNECRVLLIGTGAYAGASVRALRQRGFSSITVFSRSGRADEFADSRNLKVTKNLKESLTETDLVVCCSGTGGHVLDVDLIRQTTEQTKNPLLALDLSLSHDIDPAVAQLPRVRLWTLSDLQHQMGPLGQEQIAQAEELVEHSLGELLTILQERQIDPAVLALRSLVASMVDDEVARLSSPVVTNEAASHALRRLAARLMHVPMVQARRAAAQGRAEDFYTALNELWGLEVEPGLPLFDTTRLPDPNTLESTTCPATGFGIDDLTHKPRLEAV